MFYVLMFYLITRPPPESKRTNSLFPDTTLFRSADRVALGRAAPRRDCASGERKRKFRQEGKRTRRRARNIQPPPEIRRGRTIRPAPAGARPLPARSAR